MENDDRPILAEDWRETADARAHEERREQTIITEEYGRGQEMMATWLRDRGDFYGGEIGRALKERARTVARGARASREAADRQRWVLGMGPRQDQVSLFDVPGGRAGKVSDLIADTGRNRWGWVDLWGSSKGLLASGPERLLWAQRNAPTRAEIGMGDRPRALLISDGPERLAVWIPPRFSEHVEIWSPGKDIPGDWAQVNGLYMSKPEWVE